MPAPESSFDVVLFDVGGVMLTNGWDHNERAVVLKQFSLDKAEFEARHAEPYDKWERDTITITDYLNAAVFYEPRNFSQDDFIAAMKAVSVPIPNNAMPVLKELSATQRFLVGLLNNESRLLHEYRMDKFELRPYLDIQLSSCYLGMRKPEADIYHRALDIVGCAPGRVVFIDDRAENANAAAAQGMHAIQFTGEAALRTTLKELAIL